MKEEISIMYSEEVLNNKIEDMAKQISKDYEGKSIHLICILKGSIFFCCELAKRLTVPVTIDFMSASSYGSSTKSSGVVKIVKDLDEPLKDKNVLDILGQPVLYYPANAGKKSKVIDSWYCRSDDEKIR